MCLISSSCFYGGFLDANAAGGHDRFSQHSVIPCLFFSFVTPFYIQSLTAYIPSSTYLSIYPPAAAYFDTNIPPHTYPRTPTHPTTHPPPRRRVIGRAGRADPPSGFRRRARGVHGAPATAGTSRVTVQFEGTSNDHRTQ